MSEKEFDPAKLAIALAYERGKDQAPHIAAKGKGFIAEQIIKLAKESGVEVREDADLVTLLSSLDIGDMIPLEAYAAVAEILSYLYRTNNRAKEGNRP